VKHLLCSRAGEANPRTISRGAYLLDICLPLELDIEPWWGTRHRDPTHAMGVCHLTPAQAQPGPLVGETPVTHCLQVLHAVNKYSFDGCRGFTKSLNPMFDPEGSHRFRGKEMAPIPLVLSERKVDVKMISAAPLCATQPGRFRKTLGNRISGPTTILKRAALAVCLLAGSLQASTIISDFPPTQSAYIGWSASGGTIEFAYGFTMPSGSSYLLTSLDVQLFYTPGNVTGGDPYSFSLYLNTPLSGSPLTTFQLPSSVSTADAVYNLAPNSPVLLLGGATYYLAYARTGLVAGGGVNWDGLGVPAGIASPSTTVYQVVDGTVFPFTSNYQNTYAINGTVTPEPASIAVVAGGIAILLLALGRRAWPSWRG
jgi:hypothetical protein